MIKHTLLRAFLAVPAGCDIVLFLFFLLPTFHIDTSFLNANPYLFPYTFLLHLGSSIILYIFLTAYHITNLFWRKNRFSKVIQNTYSTSQNIIITSSSLTLSTYITVVSIFSAAYMMQLYDDTVLLIAVTTKVGVMIGFLLVTKLLNKKLQKIGSIISILFIGIIMSGIGYLIYGFYQEFSPKHFSTFPLDDKKAIYILNYDGDYWITYYYKRHHCTTITGRITCQEYYEKKGNAPITSSPIDLKPFIDQHVKIIGEFVKIHGPLEGEQKQICIANTCRKSPGPGQWVSSPINISSIQKK